MLTSISSADFVIMPLEETNRFSDAEEQRLVDDGLAEYVVVAKPKQKETAKKKKAK